MKKPESSNAANQLPLWADVERAIPNHLARSSLFSPIARDKRKHHHWVLLASPHGVVIKYDGPQLDMSDCDVFMQALHEIRLAPVGERVRINRGTFMRALGRTGHGHGNYIWLAEAFTRLFTGALMIETKRYKIGGGPPHLRASFLHLIDSFDYDSEEEAFYLSVDRRIVKMFSNNEYALPDWDKRKRLERRVNMAKWLQGYIATHAPGVHRISLKLLMAQMDYTSPLRKFKDALSEALSELERVGVITAPAIEPSTRGDQQAVWTKEKAIRGKRHNIPPPPGMLSHDSDGIPPS